MNRPTDQSVSEALTLFEADRGRGTGFATRMRARFGNLLNRIVLLVGRLSRSVLKGSLLVNWVAIKTVGTVISRLVTSFGKPTSGPINQVARRVWPGLVKGIGVGVGIGNVFSSLIHAVARNPSLAKQLFGYSICSDRSNCIVCANDGLYYSLRIFIMVLYGVLLYWILGPDFFQSFMAKVSFCDGLPDASESTTSCSTSLEGHASGSSTEGEFFSAESEGSPSSNSNQSVTSSPSTEQSGCLELLTEKESEFWQQEIVNKSQEKLERLNLNPWEYRPISKDQIRSAIRFPLTKPECEAIVKDLLEDKEWHTRITVWLKTDCALQPGINSQEFLYSLLSL